MKIRASRSRLRNIRRVALLGACFGLVATAAIAQDTPSDNATVNLIRLLVKEGVIKQKAADALLTQAEAEAAEARAAQAASPARVAREKPTARSAAAGAAQPAAPDLPPPAPGATRVQYVPQSVRNEIREQIKDEVMAQAKAENWAQPEAVPQWTKRFRLFGDLRVRDQFNLYSNNNTNEFIDFATFNANGPIDINNVTNPNGLPFLNTIADRTNLFSIRARLGLEATITDDFSAIVRLATGDTNSPVSTTQALGGGFVKKGVWLDQAYFVGKPATWASFMVGRMPNPFMHTDLVYDDNLNFDGAAASFSARPETAHGFNVFANLGGFPLEYESSNFPANSVKKSGNFSKWLAGAQLGVSWLAQDFDWKFGVAYYDYYNVQGQLSQPCALYNGNKDCSTDQTRPAFMQKGNTLFLLRDIIPDPAHPLNFAQPQYAGLSFDYNVLDATSSIDFPITGKYHAVLQGDYARNLAYDAKVPYRFGKLGNPINNISTTSSGGIGPLDSGPNAWMAKGTIGEPNPRDSWEWNLSLAYKYIEPDAMLDAFTDHDFHMGGTNAKGWIIGANLGVYKNTWISARWLSADQVDGPPLAIDVAQIDLNASF